MAKIAILIEKIYEDLELQYPRLRLREAGHTVEIIGPKAVEYSTSASTATPRSPIKPRLPSKQATTR